MGIGRVRPTRVLKKVTLYSGTGSNYLPAAADNSLTVEISDVPTRGIIHRISCTFVDDAKVTTIANSLDGFLITEEGATASNGVNQLTTVIARTAICQGPFDFQTSGTSGGVCDIDPDASDVVSVDCFELVPRYPGGQVSVSPYQPLTGATAQVQTPNDESLDAGTVVAEVVRPNLGPMKGIYYDVSGTVKGPIDSSGKLYFHVLGTGTNFTTKTTHGAYLQLEIEPCF
jgi:hypothetical protein